MKVTNHSLRGVYDELVASKPGFIVMHFDLFDHLEDLELYARRLRNDCNYQGRLILIAGRTSLDFILPDEIDCLFSGLLQPDLFPALCCGEIWDSIFSPRCHIGLNRDAHAHLNHRLPVKLT